MLYLVTGANGSFKTLTTLKLVKEMADKEGRPVCYNGRFDLVEDGPLANWRKIDVKDWQAEPDGTIFFFDEAHNDWPLRPASEKVPEHVRMLGEHRKRGFDFFIITQHPNNLDLFIRRLIGNPGWHRHMKRIAGAELVSQLQWDAVNSNCEKPGAGRTGQVTMVAPPKEVYSWYRSATLHTAKRKIPKQVYVLGVCLVLVPLLGYFAFKTVVSNVTGKADTIAGVVPGAPGTPGQAGRAAGGGARPLSAQEFASAYTPRIPGLPWTAPKYDEVTSPVEAPYPAACIDGVPRGSKVRECKCYTQQATLIPSVGADLCRQIAANGFFLDWKASGGDQAAPARREAPAAPAAATGERAAAAPGGGAAGLVVLRGETVGTLGTALLSSPGEDTAPVFSSGPSDSRLVGAPSPQEARDASILASMRDGQWARR